MRKMAADFLDSNLLNPTAPSEISLKEARLRRVHLGERNKWRLSQNEAETQTQQRKVLSCSLRNGRQSANNKTDLAGDQPPGRILESSDETFLKGVPIQVLLHSTNLRQMQKDLMKYDMNIDTYCKDVLSEKMRLGIEHLSNPSVSLSVIEEDKEAQADVLITGEMKRNENVTTSEEPSGETPLYQDSCGRNLSYAQKNRLYGLHCFFNANSRRGAKKEDKILLVRESTSELDLRQQRDSPPASHGKRKNELRYFLVKRIQNLWHRWLKEKNKDAIPVEVSAPENKKTKKKKKKRRLGKKNVYRTGRRLGKSVVGSLVSMSYASPTSYYRGYLVRERSFDAGSVRGLSNPRGSSWGCGNYPI
ncbi:uncharacterized protein LOC135205414 isoform X2 [Macrobrachium nipponense]|uniref:uncharacterized protein LOC135205414 isoform X2 n=1 Tax=Macrobrachium nipponense TaxID=159736 RepID=UPI0030C7E1BB